MIPEFIRPKLIARGMSPEADEETAREWLRGSIPGLSRLFDFIEIVYHESDRGCVICATSFIDDALGCAIRGFLQELSNAPKTVLDALLSRRPMPPIGSFAVRSRMARALGLIDDTILSALDAMRPMRNDAAHLAKSFSFENEEYKIATLFTPLSEKEQIYLRALHLVRGEAPDRFPPIRRIFELAVGSIFYRLNNIAEKPSWYASLIKSFGSIAALGPYDKYYDDLMADEPSMPSSSNEGASSAS